MRIHYVCKLYRVNRKRNNRYYVFSLVFRPNPLTPDAPKYNTNAKPRLPFLKPKPSTGSAFCPVVSQSSVPYVTAERGVSLCSREEARRCPTPTELEQRSSNDPATAAAVRSPTRSFQNGTTRPLTTKGGRDFFTPKDSTTATDPGELEPTSADRSAVSSPAEISCHARRYEADATVRTCWGAENAAAVSRRPNDCPEFVGIERLPKFRGARGLITAAMEIAPDRPFTPIAVTGPIMKPTPWISLPVEDNDDDVARPESPLVAALKTAPERSYSPLPSFVYADELIPTPLPVDERMTTKTAAAVARARPVGNNPVRYVHGYNNNYKKTPAVESAQRPISAVSSITATVPVVVGTKPAYCPSPSVPDAAYGNPAESRTNQGRTSDIRAPPDANGWKSRSGHATPEHDAPPIRRRDVPSSTAQRSSVYASNVPAAIENRTSTRPRNAQIGGDTFLKRPSNNEDVPSPDETFSSSNNRKPNAVKLIRAIPFFSNSASLPSSP